MKKLIIAVLATSGAMIVHAQAENAGRTGPASGLHTEMRTLIRGGGMDVAALANLLQQRSKAGFKEIDADGDGALTRDELLAAAGERAQKSFERMDRNGDGIVRSSDGEGFGRHHRHGGRHDRNAEERADRMSERAQKRFSQIDSNDDGMLSPEEFKAGTQERYERMQERHETRAERREQRGERHAGMPREMRKHHREMRALLREGADLEHFTAAMQERASARFDRLDADGNGKVDAAEFSARIAERAERMFARMDRNDDGMVTRDDHRGGKPRGERSRPERQD